MRQDALYLPDRADGTYQNPVLLCDYSDPDVIRVGDTYYLTASSFNYTPGLPILVSRDLVNWELKNYALPRIPGARYDAPCHACGVWAPAIRYHDGYFYICYGMPDEGIYMVRARDALGKWEEPVLLMPGKGLIDPCPFWDEDGRAYVIHAYAKSRIGFNSYLGIFHLSPDGLSALTEDRLLYDARVRHPTMEGPKVYKRQGWYYIFAPAGGVSSGWQVVLRSRKIEGPYEDRVVLRQGSSPVNGPHQGAWVDTPAGENWFLHFQSRGLYGRVVHLQPMTWREDGWPVIGMPDPAPVPPESIPAPEPCRAAALIANGADCGIPVPAWKKPECPACPPLSLQASDDFAKGLGLQWQFMANPRPDAYEAGGGRLRLFARKLPDGSCLLWQCPQVLTQKVACLAFSATVSLDASALRPHEQAGLGLVGGQCAYLAVRREEAGYVLCQAVSDGADHQESVMESLPLANPQITLRLVLTPTGYAEGQCLFSCSWDGERFAPFGLPHVPSRHTWVGARLALFAMSWAKDGAPEGFADFGPFQVEPLQGEIPAAAAAPRREE